MAIRKKQQHLQNVPDNMEEWLSTYTALTAKTLFERLGVRLPDAVLSQQLHDKTSFYRKLVRLPALNAFNDLIRAQCRDIQAYSQQRVIDYIFSGEADKPDTAPGAMLRSQIEQQRLALIESGKKLTALEHKHFAHIDNINSLLQEEVQHWQQLVDDITEQTWQLLQRHGVMLEDKYKARLRELFDQQAAGITVPDTALHELKIKDAPSPWVKALIKLLLEVNSHA